jgi:hypothetical protein
MGDFALEVAEASLTYMSIYSGGVNAPIPPKIGKIIFYIICSISLRFRNFIDLKTL